MSIFSENLQVFDQNNIQRLPGAPNSLAIALLGPEKRPISAKNVIFSEKIGKFLAKFALTCSLISCFFS